VPGAGASSSVLGAAGVFGCTSPFTPPGVAFAVAVPPGAGVGVGVLAAGVAAGLAALVAAGMSFFLL
jgi:hypothetical protein